MPKFITSFIIFFTFFSIAPSVHAVNLIKNSDFENGITDWDSYTGNASAQSVTEEKKTGDKSILIKNTKTGSYGAQQIILGIAGNQNYKLEGWAKNSETNPAQKIRIRIAWYESEDASGSQLSVNDTNQVETKEWSLLQLETKSPENAKSAKIRLILKSPNNGEVAQTYFDNISLNKFDPAPTPTLTLTPALPPSPTPVPTKSSTPTKIPIPTLKPTPSSHVTVFAKTTPTLYQSRPTTIKIKTSDIADSEPTKIDELRKKIIQPTTTGQPQVLGINTDNSNTPPNFLALSLIGGGTLLLIISGIPILKNLKLLKNKNEFTLK